MGSYRKTLLVVRASGMETRESSDRERLGEENAVEESTDESMPELEEVDLAEELSEDSMLALVDPSQERLEYVSG